MTPAERVKNMTAERARMMLDAAIERIVALSGGDYHSVIDAIEADVAMRAPSSQGRDGGG